MKPENMKQIYSKTFQLTQFNSTPHKPNPNQNLYSYVKSKPNLN